MSFNRIEITDLGKEMITSTLMGKQMTITKVEIGNGEKYGSENAIGNKILNGEVTKFEKAGTNTVRLTYRIDNSQNTSGFYWSEMGIFAKIDGEEEKLYAYAYTTTPEYIPPATDNYIGQIETEILISVGNAEQVTAIVGEYGGYVTKIEFESHINAENPHNITKETIGLENVENLIFSENLVDFNERKQLEEIKTGENLKTIIAKLAFAIKKIKLHLEDTISHVNVKEKTKWNNKAEEKHTHNATDINSGTLSIARGGTGATSGAEAMQKLGITNNKWQEIQLNSGVTEPSVGYKMQYRKTGDIVFLNGQVGIKNKKSGESTLVYTLPIGYRPSQNQLYFLQATGGKRVARWFIMKDGRMYCEWIFDLATGKEVTGEISWVALNISFQI